MRRNYKRAVAGAGACVALRRGCSHLFHLSRLVSHLLLFRAIGADLPRNPGCQAPDLLPLCRRFCVNETRGKSKQQPSATLQHTQQQAQQALHVLFAAVKTRSPYGLPSYVCEQEPVPQTPAPTNFQHGYACGSGPCTSTTVCVWRVSLRRGAAARRRPSSWSHQLVKNAESFPRSRSLLR